jgi:hypothetical protein
MMSRILLSAVVALALIRPVAGQDALTLDETCTVTIGNQTALVRPDGSFLIRNISIFVPGRL